MNSAASKTLGLTSSLKQVRLDVISVECKTCGRTGEYDRSQLVRKFGAGITFARLRRMTALGCDRMVTSDGDRCGVSFPCLGEARTNAPLK